MRMDWIGVFTSLDGREGSVNCGSDEAEVMEQQDRLRVSRTEHRKMRCSSIHILKGYIILDVWDEDR